MVDAVRILCEEMLALPWAGEFPWERWKQPHLDCPEVAATTAAASPVPAEGSASTPFADVDNGAEALKRFPEPFERLRTELRTRHYSIRTENSYASWLARFLAFHDYRSPDSLGAADVKAYLEYLATVRRVSASTQTQALCALVFFYAQVLKRPPQLRGWGDGETGGRGASRRVCRRIRDPGLSGAITPTNLGCRGRLRRQLAGPRSPSG
jgi:hypothetical protein